MAKQKTFSSVKFGFRWTGGGGYSYNAAAAEGKARDKRDAFARDLVVLGYKVRKSVKVEQVSKGGLGTDKPYVVLMSRTYTVSWS